jgi:TRAP-type C4-dicarboxylate transport system substrate-binding protein
MIVGYFKEEAEMKKTLLLSCSRMATFMLVVLGIIFFISPLEAAEQITLKAAYYAADDHPITKLGRASLADVEKLTEGRVKIIIYSNSTLVPTTEMASAVDEGTAFCANWYMPYMSNTIPLFDLETQAVWRGGTYQAVIGAYNNGINDLYTEALIRQGLKNTKVAGVSMCNWRILGMTKKQVKVPADAKGMKIRSVGAEADMWRSLGASPVNITSPQTYEALSRGIAEGATNALQIMSDRRWLEYIKYVTNLKLTPVLMHIIYNTKIIKQLNPKDQDIVEKAMKNVAEYTRNGLIELEENVTKNKAVKEFGVQFYNPTLNENAIWQKAADPMVEAYEISKDPLIQKSLQIVYKYNPKK